MKNQLEPQCILAGQRINCRGPKGKEQLSLTHIHHAAGKPAGKRPTEWLRHEDTRAFIAELCQSLDVVPDHIIQAHRGRFGGTWAHWAIAVKYAAFLDKKLEDQLIRAWRQLKEESADPDLAVDGALDRLKQHCLAHYSYSESEAEEWAQQRMVSKVHRNSLTREWNKRGARNWDYAHLTNDGYRGLFGKTAAQLREQYHLPPRTNMRDHLTLSNLALVSLFEQLTRDRLQIQDVYGTDDMSEVSMQTGKQLASAVSAIRSSWTKGLPNKKKGSRKSKKTRTRSSQLIKSA